MHRPERGSQNDSHPPARVLMMVTRVTRGRNLVTMEIITQLSPVLGFAGEAAEGPVFYLQFHLQ